MAASNYELSAVLFFVFRYFRLIVNLISHWTYRSISIPQNPTYTSEDVTVIIPTIDANGEELRQTIQTCLNTGPAEVIVVTVETHIKKALKLVAEFKSNKVRILDVAKANKRRQMCRAIPEVMTKITIFADDDVIWPTTLVPWMLAPFENEKIGAVGTCQGLVRPKNPTLWTFLGSLYLERRNFDCSACSNIDGGLPCLSGRTVAYRTRILQEERFTFDFTNETWRTYQLNADDDNFMTRWMFNHGWEIKMQYDKACKIQTTLKGGPWYLKQCLRWVRSNWRSNLTSMFVDRRCWWTHPWTTYAVFQTTLTAWAFLDPVLFYLIYRASETWNLEYRTGIRVFAAIWIFLFAKTIKLIGHYIRYPTDVALLPISILFGYIHGIIKLVGLCTLSETAWGSREGADTDNKFRTVRLSSYESYGEFTHETVEVRNSFDYDKPKLPQYYSYDH
ncbi:Hypothetical protein D9617_173g015910 [Elsinoe fawcettii]|nr:Hypothetical protein D9617_173g015910 [Elsinoe fawcettii]